MRTLQLYLEVPTVSVIKGVDYMSRCNNILSFKRHLWSKFATCILPHSKLHVYTRNLQPYMGLSKEAGCR